MDALLSQAVGIPQGSVLSGLLCNYFFGHIEKRLLGDILDGSVPERPHLPPGGGGGEARGPSARAVGLESRSDGIGGGSVSQDEGATSSFAPPARGKRARPGEREREREGERPPKFAGISPSCSCLGDAAAPDSDRASRRGVLGVPNGRGGGGSDGNRGPHETPQRQSCRNTANQNGRGRGSYGPVGGARGGERCRLGGNGDDEQRGRGPAEGEESGEERPFPDPEGDCTLLRQVDDFLLVSEDGVGYFCRFVRFRAGRPGWSVTGQPRSLLAFLGVGFECLWRENIVKRVLTFDVVSHKTDGKNC